MELEQLLQTDPDAAALFHALPGPVQQRLSQWGGDIRSLAALREYAADMTAQSGLHDNGLTGEKNGIPLDPELSAEWTKAHQA